MSKRVDGVQGTSESSLNRPNALKVVMELQTSEIEMPGTCHSSIRLLLKISEFTLSTEHERHT
jgi:hypothetical protein